MNKSYLRSAFDQFLSKRQIEKTPDWYPLQNDLCDVVQNDKWSLQGIIGLWISGDLQETINELNAWGRRIVDWSAWLSVLEMCEGDEAWRVSDLFLETIAFYCLLQPSSARDRFGWIATNSIHQANLSVDRDYKDKLDQDKKYLKYLKTKTTKHKKQHGYYLSRKETEVQLRCIGARWTSYAAFESSVLEMDSDGYRTTTRNFRNLASHKIAPRFERGQTNFVVRSIGLAKKMVEQANGSYQQVDDPDLIAVYYGFGGTPPLSLREMYEVNKRELALAIKALHAYEAILREIMGQLGVIDTK